MLLRIYLQKKRPTYCFQRVGLRGYRDAVWLTDSPSQALIEYDNEPNDEEANTESGYNPSVNDDLISNDC